MPVAAVVAAFFIPFTASTRFKVIDPRRLREEPAGPMTEKANPLLTLIWWLFWWLALLAFFVWYVVA